MAMENEHRNYLLNGGIALACIIFIFTFQHAIWNHVQDRRYNQKQLEMLQNTARKDADWNLVKIHLENQGYRIVPVFPEEDIAPGEIRYYQCFWMPRKHQSRKHHGENENEVRLRYSTRGIIEVDPDGKIISCTGDRIEQHSM